MLKYNKNKQEGDCKHSINAAKNRYADHTIVQINLAC